jgi:hypothetical protein
MANRFGKTEGSLYLVELYNAEERFLKIGVTTTSINRRFKGFKYKLKKIKNVKSDVRDVFKMETKILRRFKKSQYVPSQRFAGSTECFDPSIKEEVLEYIKKIK